MRPAAVRAHARSMLLANVQPSMAEVWQKLEAEEGKNQGREAAARDTMPKKLKWNNNVWTAAVLNGYIRSTKKQNLKK